MKEVDRIRKEYLQNKNFKFGFFGGLEKCQNILDCIFQATEFEEPDFYYYNNQKCYLFFQFFLLKIQNESCLYKQL